MASAIPCSQRASLLRALFTQDDTGNAVIGVANWGAKYDSILRWQYLGPTNTALDLYPREPAGGDAPVASQSLAAVVKMETVELLELPVFVCGPANDPTNRPAANPGFSTLQ